MAVRKLGFIRKSFIFVIIREVVRLQIYEHWEIWNQTIVKVYH